MLLREATEAEDVLALLDCKSEITEVRNWVGEGAKAVSCLCRRRQAPEAPLRAPRLSAPFCARWRHHLRLAPFRPDLRVGAKRRCVAERKPPVVCRQAERRGYSSGNSHWNIRRQCGYS
jgi:hypothetical protein